MSLPPVAERAPARPDIHEMRRAVDGRYLCTMRTCPVAGTLADALEHVSRQQWRMRYGDSDMPMLGGLEDVG